MVEEIIKVIRVKVTGLSMGTSAKGDFHILETAPPSGLKYPVKYNIFELALMQGVEIGSEIELTLKRGRAKKENPSFDGDFYWDVLSLKVLGKGEKGAEIQTPVLAPGYKESPRGEELPWHRFVAWGEVLGVALKIVAMTASLGENEESGSPAYERTEFAERFNWALGVICQAIRNEMKED